MGWFDRVRAKDGRRTSAGLLMRLLRDRGGNTLAIMAAMMIPMSALTGSAVDMARLYVAKVRLQQACDAGVLAGRKFMAVSASPTLDTNAAAQAQAFFGNNFKKDTSATSPGYMTSTGVSFTPSKTTDNQVAGVAQATVPMTIMKMFGYSNTTLNVTCQARYDVADTDIMFVLDTTGSMACLTSQSQSDCDNYVVNNTVQANDGSFSVTEQSNSRISGLRSAVLSFYDTVTAAADPSTHFRYGFVPYNATANVGALLQPLGYMVAGNWNYQSRIVAGDANNGNSSSYGTFTNVSQATCASYNNTRSPATGWQSDGTAIRYNTSWTAANSGTCSISQQPLIPLWKYQQTAFSVSQFIQGNTVDNPAQVTSATSKWNGCVEERDTITGTTFDPNNPPPDLDIDTAPTSDATRWRPMWPDVEFARQSNGETTSATRTNLTRFYSGYPLEYAGVSNELPCPKAATRLTTMSRTDIANYLSASSGFKPYGVTYHDAGLVWGARLLSPNGMFAADTAAWPGHNTPNRYIVFLTDGTMETDEMAYTAHGLENYDNRVGSNGDSGQLTTIHNARFTATCQIAKAHNFTIFVIAYAQTLTSQLQACATPGQAYYASDSTALTAAFQKIANQVARLRISQ